MRDVAIVGTEVERSLERRSEVKRRIAERGPSSLPSVAITRSATPSSSQAYAARPKAGPTGPGMEVPEHSRVRHDPIDRYGKLTLRHRSRLHHIGIGRAHAGTRVLMLARDVEIRVITEDGELLRELTLDPTRDYQARRTCNDVPRQVSTMSRDITAGGR